MNQYSIDDIVVCKIKNSLITLSDDKDFDEKLSFKIIGVQRNDFSSDEYIIFIPEYLLGKVASGVRVGRGVIKSFLVDPRFEGDYMAYIRNNLICSTEWKCDGAFCEGSCREYFQWAGPNQEDGTFICGPCRQNPWR